MEPLPPDPYLALGVPRDATLAAIKTAYRKAALKCHPDKVPDKGDEFHKINTAYQLIGEEEDRQKYEAEVRLYALKKEQQNRFGGGHSRGSDIRTAAFDVRGSPRPGFHYQAKTASRYDTAERRPSGAFASARSSPYVRDESADYFGPQASAKKYDSYDEAPRKNSSAKTPHREEARKAEVKKEKASSKHTVREENRKQRDKDVRYNRRAKAASIASIDSDDSDFDSPPTKKENIRKDAYVKKKESKRSDDDYYERTKRPENHRTSTAKDYIQRSRTDGPPAERGPPPPAYNPGSRRDTRSPSPPPRRREEYPTKVRGPSDRPELVRRSSAKPKEKSSPTESSRPVRPGMPRKVSTSRRSPSPDDYVRPSLQKMVSEPQSIRIPPPETDSRRDRSYTQEPYRAEARDPPAMRRAQTDAPTSKTSPFKQSRRDDATPVQSSRLRNVETPANNDSGYSTSSPSEDSPPQTQKTSRQERYPMDELKSSQYSREAVDRDTQRRPSVENDRVRAGPPPSRSASYAYEAARNSDDGPRRASATQTPRRPSLQHSESERRPPSTQEVPLRRQTLERETSGRSSSRNTPTLSKTQTMPPLRTGRLFGEMDPPLTRSPVNYSGSDEDDYDRPRRSSPLERSSPVDRSDKREYRKHMGQNLDSGYGSYGPAQPQSRRASEDIGKVRAEANSRAHAASRYMEETMRPAVRRQGTYAGY